MFLAIENLISPAEAKVLRDAAEKLAFSDGRETAGRYAAKVKANQQATPSSELDAIQAKITDSLTKNALFQLAARPRALTPLILSRYRVGQTYGTHIDDAMMQGLRTDLSFTLFLSDPETYDGGALVIQDTLEDREIKLEAGGLFLYPSTTLHRVSPVTKGERLAVVGWVNSLIRRADQREILFDLDRSLRQIFDTDGKSETFDLLAKSRSNLLRMWGDD
jgi:PKHD-type hydroxylase